MNPKTAHSIMYLCSSGTFIILCIFVVVGIRETYNVHGSEGYQFIFGQLTVGELLIGLGTAILATFTAILAVMNAGFL